MEIADQEDREPPACEINGATFTVAGEEFSVIAVPGAKTICFDELTGAENEVCQLMLGGLSNAEIAGARGTSVNTVENQAASIFRKLDVCSRAELAALVRSRG